MKNSRQQLWQALKKHYHQIKDTPLSSLFTADNQRQIKYTDKLDNQLIIDYARHCFNDQTCQLWNDLANVCNIPNALTKLHAGDIVNLSENQPALHSALRKPVMQALPEIKTMRAQMADAVTYIHQRQHLFTDIINIGIGGSDLGPQMTTLALSPYYAVTSQRNHFISTLDFHQIDVLLKQLDPAKTVLIISSKSFSTQEAIVNAKAAKAWMGEYFAEQVFGITQNLLAAKAFGIPEHRILPLWSWVGGRYSIWSAIGLPLAMQIGMENFESFLAGGYAIDQYMLNTPIAHNGIAKLAFLNVWETSFFKAATHAILPYDARLSRLPAYLQQLEMESNGKSINQQNKPVNYLTGPIIWGETGTNGQHAFHQLLHQGTQYVPVDFIIMQKPHHSFHDQHHMLLAHCFAQAETLLNGHYSAEFPYKNIAGNKPSTILTLPELSPYYLGCLIALYEYKVFISAMLWNINPFDQWGVEAGKKTALLFYQQFATPQH